MSYYKRFNRSDYEGFAPAERAYERYKELEGSIMGSDQDGEFVMVKCELVDEFILTALSREDIKAQGYNPDVLSDKDMHYFADELCDNLIANGGYWDTIDYLASEVFNCPPLEEENDDED